MKFLLTLICLLAVSNAMAHRDEQPERYYQQAPALGYPHAHKHGDSRYYPPTQKREKKRKRHAQNQVFQLRNDSGQCLAATRGGVEAYRCRNHPNQLWRQVGQQLINQNLCLTVRKRGGLYNGQGVKLSACNNGKQQDWHYDSKSRLQYHRGFCLDLDSNTMHHDGGKIQLWNCHHHQNQRWSRQLPPPEHHRH